MSNRLRGVSKWPGLGKLLRSPFYGSILGNAMVLSQNMQPVETSLPDFLDLSHFLRIYRFLPGGLEKLPSQEAFMSCPWFSFLGRADLLRAYQESKPKRTVCSPTGPTSPDLSGESGHRPNLKREGVGVSQFLQLVFPKKREMEP